jgi:hypothetical protein
MTLRQCLCDQPGFCPHHKRPMDGVLHQLCQKHPKYRALFGNSSNLPKAFVEIAPEDLPCVLRGAVVRDANCQREDCTGGVLFPVFACAKHGECSVQARGIKGLKVCRKCPDRTNTPKAVAPTPAADIAVVIPCHNYGRFVEAAINSVLAQSLRPSAILVVDDRSTDETAAVVAPYYGRGVRYLPVNNGNAHATRSDGFHATRSEWVCFLDADDELPPNYLEEAARRFAPGVGLVFSDVEQFGEASGRLVYEAGDINAKNFAHAGSLVRRVAAESARVFDQWLPPEVLEDWWTWRQIFADGWQAAKSSAVYRYRRHGAGRSTWLGQQTWSTQYGVSLDEVTIAIPLAGRRKRWPQMRAWLEAQTWPHAQTGLLLVDTSANPEFSAEVRAWLAGCDYPGTQYVALDVADPGVADADRTEDRHYRAVQRAMPRIYNRIRREVSTPWLLVVEDDVTPPLDVIARLSAGFDGRTASVSGVYRSRYQPVYVAWRPNGEAFVDAGEGVQEVGGNGWGCVLLRSSVVRDIVLHHGGRGDFDPNFYESVRGLGLLAKVDWSVRCRHADLA